MGASGDIKRTQLKRMKEIKNDIQKGLYNNKICEIKNIIKGLGFFCKITSPDTKEITPVLITSNQLLGAKDIIPGKKIEFNLNNETHSLNIDDSRKVYFESELYKITILEIKKEDNLDIDSFFDIEINNKKIDLKYLQRQTIVLLNKNYDNELDVSICEIKNLNKNGYEIEYKCNLDEEIYGYPLLNADSNKIIAFHKNFIVMDDICQGILLGNIIKDFNKIKKNIGDYKLDEDKKKKIKRKY